MCTRTLTLAHACVCLGQQPPHQQAEREPTHAGHRRRRDAKEAQPCARRRSWTRARTVRPRPARGIAARSMSVCVARRPERQQAQKLQGALRYSALVYVTQRSHCRPRVTRSIHLAQRTRTQRRIREAATMIAEKDLEPDFEVARHISVRRRGSDLWRRASALAHVRSAGYVADRIWAALRRPTRPC